MEWNDLTYEEKNIIKSFNQLGINIGESCG